MRILGRNAAQVADEVRNTKKATIDCLCKRDAAEAACYERLLIAREPMMHSTAGLMKKASASGGMTFENAIDHRHAKR